MILFWTFNYLSSFCAGMMLVLQIQHFGLYPMVGPESFAAYIAANNRAAIFPAIIGALTLTILSVAPVFDRPQFVSGEAAAICVALNLVNLMSTAIWQGRMHATLARTGYDRILVRRLIATNWIRTLALLFQSFVAFMTLLRQSI